jgi:hypothetical protein
MRYEKSETILRIALDTQGSTLGLSLEDIQRGYADRPLSRRTAERLRDAVERLFPEIEQSNPGEVPKRWRLPGGAVGGLAKVTADELADLTTAISVLRREHGRSGPEPGTHTLENPGPPEGTGKSEDRARSRCANRG